MSLCVRRNVCSVVFWLLSAAGIVSAQVGFSLPISNNITPGSTLTVPVKVTGFTNIVGVQFVISWDKNVLSFSSVNGLNLPALDASDFNTTQAVTDGILRFAWVTSDSPNSGTTRPDGTTIFQLVFTVTGPLNSGTAITITEVPPTGFEVNQVVNGSLQAYGINQVQIMQGFAAVGYTVGTSDIANDPAWPVSISPNPFSNRTQIFFEIKERADIQVIITDVAGKIVLKKNIFSAEPGQHGMEIASSELDEKGMYFLILRTDKRSCVRLFSLI